MQFFRVKEAVAVLDRPRKHHVFNPCAGADVVNDQVAIDSV